MTSRLPAELVVGFEDIDEQHRTLFQRLDAAIQAAVADDSAGARAAMSALGDNLAAHFNAEESFMTATLYPERGRHKAAHDLFMQDFAALNEEMRLSGLSVPVVQWIRSRLREWVSFHIQVNDAPLARYLASKRFRPQAQATQGGKARSV
jgi:hemerythrin